MSEHLPGEPVKILLVEDNAGDVYLLRESLEEVDLPCNLSVVENGQEAMAFLRRQGSYASAARPDLILLDLNLPIKDGWETLEEIKGDHAFKRIPVIVHTTSNKEEEVQRCYDLHANCYITKPLSFDQFTKVAKGLKEFWFNLVTLPPPTSG